MTGERSIRWRLVLLFCLTAGVLLGISYAGLYVVFHRVIHRQFDRRLSEVATPIIADLAADPDDKDVDLLNIPDEYFEVLDLSGKVLQRSLNLAQDLPIAVSEGFQTVQLPNIGEVRAAVIPFQAGEYSWLFVAAGSTRESNEALAALRRFALVLLPATLLLTAAVFGFYSNQLLAKIDVVVCQLRQFVSDASHAEWRRYRVSNAFDWRLFFERRRSDCRLSSHRNARRQSGAIHEYGSGQPIWRRLDQRRAHR